MPGFLARLDALVLPSVWLENSPLAIEEAFAGGVPVIASDLGGMAESVRHEVDGLRFPAGDADALSRCLRRLIDEPGLNSHRLRAGIREPLSIAVDAAQTLARYQALTTASSPPAASRSDSCRRWLLNYGAPEQTVLAAKSLQSSFVPPRFICVVDNSPRAGAWRAPQAADRRRASSHIGNRGQPEPRVRRRMQSGHRRGARNRRRVRPSDEQRRGVGAGRNRHTPGRRDGGPQSGDPRPLDCQACRAGDHRVGGHVVRCRNWSHAPPAGRTTSHRGATPAATRRRGHRLRDADPP